LKLIQDTAGFYAELIRIFTVDRLPENSPEVSWANSRKGIKGQF